MPVLRTRYDEKTGHSPNNPRQQVIQLIQFYIQIINIILYILS